MLLASWLRTLRRRRLGPSSCQARLDRRPQCMPLRPRLEALEDRTVPSTFVITTTADTDTYTSNPAITSGSLRDAINYANNYPGPVTITFGLPADDPHHYYYRDDGHSGQISRADIAVTTAADDSAIPDIDPDWRHSWWSIQPTSSLPSIGNTVLIDGYSQPGASPNTLCGVGQLGKAPGDASLYGDNAVLKIELDGSAASQLTPPGVPVPVGLGLYSSSSAVEGLVLNRWSGAAIRTGFGSGYTIQGNFIGTDVSGTTAFDAAGNHLGNVIGVDVNGQATIGGATAPDRNLISGAWTSDINGNRSFGMGITFSYPFISGSPALVEGNFIGTDRTGTRAYDALGQPLGNANFGVDLYQSGNVVVGGTQAGEGNLLSGNRGGIDTVVAGGLVEGNFIGTDVTGTRSLPNNWVGLFLAAPRTQVGGAAAGAGNLIADGMVTSSSTIQGNWIGMNVLGEPTHQGAIDTRDGNTIGGDVAGAGTLMANDVFVNGGSNNLIVHNQFGGGGSIDIRFGATGNIVRHNTVTEAGYAVEIYQSNNNLIDSNTLSGNKVGINLGASNNNVLCGNTLRGDNVGIFLDGSNDNVLSDNHITDCATGEAGVELLGNNNVLRGNTIFSNDYGVYLDEGTANQLTQNVIYDNSQAGIGLLQGVNNNQPAPVLTNVVSTCRGTVITGTLASEPNSMVHLEFFANSVAGPGGNGEGETYLGADNPTTGADGSFTVSLPAVIQLPQPYISATATVSHSTSTFSQDFTVTNLAPTASAGGPYTIRYGDSLTLDASASCDDDNDTLTYTWTINGQALTSSGSPTLTLTGAQLVALGVSTGQVNNVSVLVDDGHGFTDSAQTTLTVTKASTQVNLVPSAATSLLNQTVTFTVTVLSISPGAGQPSGTVQFQVNGCNAGAPVPLVNGQAFWTTSALPIGPHTITAVYSGDGNFLASSSAPLVQAVDYRFGGFLPPLTQNGTSKLGSTLPIKWQLTDANGNFLSDLAAVKSLQIQSVDAQGHALAAPFNPAGSGGTTLRYDSTANQYVFNWSTKGLNAGYYEIELTLADGTVETLTLQLR